MSSVATKRAFRFAGTGRRTFRVGAFAGALLFSVAVFFVSLFLFYTVLDWQNVNGYRFAGLLLVHLVLLAGLHFLVTVRYKPVVTHFHLFVLTILFAAALVGIWKSFIVLVILIFVFAVGILPVTLGDFLARHIRPRRGIPVGLLFASVYVFYFATVVNYSYMHSFFGQFDFMDTTFNGRYTLLPNKDYDINPMRYRGPLIPQGEPGSPRILFLGDSSTYGLFLPYSRSYPALVQEQLRMKGYHQARTLNAAVPAHNLLDVAERYREFRDWNPDFVFLMEGMHVDEMEVEPRNRGSRVPPAIERHFRGIRTMFLFLFGRGSRPGHDAGRHDANVRKWSGALQALVKEISTRGATVVLLQYPSPAITDEIRTIVQHIPSAKGAVLIDLFSHFTGKESEWLMVDRIHPNTQGNREIAAIIVEYLTARLMAGERLEGGPAEAMAHEERSDCSAGKIFH